MKKRYFWGFITLIAAYIFFTIVLPPDPSSLERYKISEGQAQLLRLSIAIPISFVYLLALYGISLLKSFSKTIIKTKEGWAYNQIADGLTIFAFSLPLMSIVSAMINYVVVHQPQWLEEIVISRNYLRVIFTVIAFTLIARGAENLVMSVKGKTVFERPYLSLFGTIALTSLYTWLIVSRNSVDVTGVSSHYLPDWLVITTQAIPLLFVWCRGLRAMYHLYVYREELGGKVYRRAWELLARGIALTIAVAILMQMIVTASNRLIAINITPVLLMVYILVLGYAISFLYVAAGAKKLKMIEEA